jgi:hypothetical protein
MHIFCLWLFYFFSYFIGLIIGEFYPYFKVKEKTLNIIGFIIIFLILVVFLIFIEIIELNCYGLSENTKKNITRRGRYDSELALNLYLSDENSDIENNISY